MRPDFFFFPFLQLLHTAVVCASTAAVGDAASIAAAADLHTATVTVIQ